MHKMKCMAFMTALVILLAACQTTQSKNMGSGPLTLSPEIEASFQKYKSLEDPLAFAVSSNGKHSGYFFCNTKGECIFADAESAALKYCRENTPPSGGACKIYAVGKKVVWQGGVNVMSATRAPAPHIPTFKAPPRRPEWRVLAGSGPLKMSTKVKGAFKDYKNLQRPLAFAVSPDGKHAGWFFCTRDDSCPGDKPAHVAIENCNKRTPASGGSCRLYAVEKQVVWNAKPRVKVARAKKTPPARKRVKENLINLFGSGPLLISRRVDRAYREYAKLDFPMAFAVSNDGEHSGWFFCNKKNGCGEKDSALKSIENCNAKVTPGAAPCTLYSVKKNVVWQGPVAVLPDIQAGDSLRAALPAPPPGATISSDIAPPPSYTSPSAPAASMKASTGKVGLRKTKAFKDLEEEINRARNKKGNF